MTRRDALLAGALFTGLAVLFWSGRSRSFGPGDSPQHAVAALTWGVPHPPGYPLQTAAAHAWSRLPWAEPVAAVNGLSGLFAAGAAAVFFLLLRLQGCGAPAALAACGFMALSPLFWFYSLVAEARALNDLLALSSAYAACRWAAGGERRWLWACALLVGLGLGHHPTFLFIVPALSWWAFERKPAPKDLAVCAALAFAALCAPYLLLGARLASGEPAYNLYAVKGWADLPGLFLRKDSGGPLRMVSGTGFMGFGGFDPASLVRHAGWMAASAARHGGPALLLGLLPFAFPKEAARRPLQGWLAWLGVSGGLFLAVASQQVAICDPEYARAVMARHYLLPFVALFAAAGHGAQRLAARVRPAFVAALAAAAFVLPLALSPLSLARDNPLLDHARAMVRDSGPRDLVVLAADDSIFASIYLDLVAGEAGQRVFLTPSLFAYPPYARRLKARHPDLTLPPFKAGEGLSTDWTLWKRLNPGRAVLAEPVLRDAILDRWPASAPSGGLIRVEEKPAARSDPAADAERFLAAPETAFTRAEAREWTQEVYLLHGRRNMAEWLGSRLDPRRDGELLLRLRALLAVL
ncbi:MAG: DUF2723 domain-containing protein [Elusimicrobiota bacterium]|nr:DUF2723 domain-containing protein [Elusimicrobiota bacterium]